MHEHYHYHTGTVRVSKGVENGGPIRTVKKTMNKDYCRVIDHSPRYYNTGKVREIANTIHD